MTGKVASIPTVATSNTACFLNIGYRIAGKFGGELNLVIWRIQWRSQDIAVARAQHGHTTFVQTSARNTKAYRGSGGILPPEFYSLLGRF